MKTRLFLFIVVSLFAVASVAQDIDYHGEIGIRYMPTFSSLKAKTVDDGVVETSLTLGHGVGGFLAWNFNQHVGVQAEVIYLSLAQKYTDKALERRINVSYVNIPLLLSLNTGKTNVVNVNLVAGPQIGFNVGSKMETEGNAEADSLTAVLAVKKSDLGIAYGAGIDFGINAERTLRLGLGFRGVYGLFDISDRSQSLTTNQYYILDRSKMETYAGYVGLSLLF